MAFQVTMKWSKEKAYDFLDDIYDKKFLKTLSDEQLFDLMKQNNYVDGDNPFKKDQQSTLNLEQVSNESN